MVIAQGHIYWASLPEPNGASSPLKRPVLVVQGEPLNRSRLGTVICVPLTSSLLWADAPSNLLLPAQATGLPQDSVVNTTQIMTLDRELLTEDIGKVNKRQLQLIISGINTVLGR